MKMKLLILLFPIVALSLLIPWPVAYAHNSASAGQVVQIQTVETTVTPTKTVFGKTIGSIQPSDLFYVDASESTEDVTVTLYLTNSPKLIHNFRYMILKVSAYTETGSGSWEKATQWNGESIPDTFITMRNGQTNFLLAGLARYKIAIDGGSFYCFTADEGYSLPQFYLEVN